jgi:hypothetical protein
MMASNQLNPMSWIVGVLLLCSFLVPPTVTWLLSPEEEGGGGEQRGVATRRRAWYLLGLCWFVTVIPALEMEMWLPWGLANPCVMARGVLRTIPRC